MPSPILLASAVHTPPTSHARFEIGFAFGSTADAPPAGTERATPRASFIIAMPTKPKQNTANTIARFIPSPRPEFFTSHFVSEDSRPLAPPLSPPLSPL